MPIFLSLHVIYKPNTPVQLKLDRPIYRTNTQTSEQSITQAQHRLGGRQPSKLLGQSNGDLVILNKERRKVHY